MLLARGGGEPEKELFLGHGYTEKNNIPIHIFLKSDFEFLVSAIDTIPDLIDYFQHRKLLFSEGKVSMFTSEKDLVMLYIMDKPLVESIVKKDNCFIAIDDIQNQYELKKDEISNQFKKSYLIDDIILKQHEAIGYQGFSPIKGNNVQSQNEESYKRAIEALAKFNRAERENMAAKIIECWEVCSQNISDSNGFVFFEEKNIGFFVLASITTDRQRRANILFSRIGALCCYLKPIKIIGIATEGIPQDSISYDFAYLESEDVENCEEILNLSERWLEKFKDFKKE